MGYIYNTPGTFQEFVFLIFTCESGEKTKQNQKLNISITKVIIVLYIKMLIELYLKYINLKINFQ